VRQEDERDDQACWTTRRSRWAQPRVRWRCWLRYKNSLGALESQEISRRRYLYLGGHQEASTRRETAGFFTGADQVRGEEREKELGGKTRAELQDCF